MWKNLTTVEGQDEVLSYVRGELRDLVRIEFVRNKTLRHHHEIMVIAEREGVLPYGLRASPPAGEQPVDPPRTQTGKQRPVALAGFYNLGQVRAKSHRGGRRERSAGQAGCAPPAFAKRRYDGAAI
jgi:hypothetical protein